jgi:hypothetical protein
VPSPTTALQIIEDALGLTRAVGVDQTLTPAEISDCLRQLNDLIENWSTQQLAVYGQANQTFNAIANQKVYTIGASGDWNTVRPVRIDSPAYSSLPIGSSTPSTYPCYPITQAEYNTIAFKDQTQDYPDYFLYVNEYPLGKITLWPVPTQATPITFSIDRIITQVASASASLSFPPGYVDAFKYNLAPRLASLFGRPATPEVLGLAVSTLADIKRANRTTPVLRYDSGITRGGRRYRDWRTG